MRKKYAPDMALESADAFRTLSQVYISKLGNDMSMAGEIAVRDIGGMIASPTLLSLSLELYLKGLISFFRQQIPATHDLWKLYNLLPQDLRESAEKYYDHINSKANATDLAELIMALPSVTITDEEFSTWVKNNPTKKKDLSIKGVLKRNKDTFCTWRYLYEVRSDQIQLYDYEFSRLGYIADSLRYHLVDIINQSSEL